MCDVFKSTVFARLYTLFKFSTAIGGPDGCHSDALHAGDTESVGADDRKYAHRELCRVGELGMAGSGSVSFLVLT